MVGAAASWQMVILASSVLAVVGAVLVGRLGDGPHLKPRQDGAPPARRSVMGAFAVPEFRASAFG